MDEFYNYDEHAGPVLKPLLKKFKASAENWYAYFKQMAEGSWFSITVGDLCFGEDGDELIGKIILSNEDETFGVKEMGFLQIVFQPNAHFRLLFSDNLEERNLYEVEPRDVKMYEQDIRVFLSTGVHCPSTFFKKYLNKNSAIENPA